MPRRKEMAWRAGLFFVFLCVAQSEAAILRAQVRGFSARETERKGSSAPFLDIKFYVRGTQVRVDANIENSGSFELYDLSKNSDYEVLPLLRRYGEGGSLTAYSVKLMRSLFFQDPEAACPQLERSASAMWKNPSNPNKDRGPIACRRIGPDTVNDRKTIQYDVARPTDEGTEIHTHYWVDVGIRFLVKTEESETGNIFEFQDIKEEIPPASLFEIPAGFQKIP